METKTFTKAVKDFFGQKPGQTLKEFADELRDVYNSDQDGWNKLFEQVGVKIENRVV